MTSLAQWPELRHAFDGHVHYCDNKGVSDRMDHEEWQESSVFGFSEWARANDPDIHAEAEAQRSELGMATRVQWHRGHPERRLCKAAWCRHDRAIYKVDKMADEAYRDLAVLQMDWWHFPNKPVYEVWWRGKPLAGAGLRAGVMAALNEEANRAYWVTRRVNMDFKGECGLRRALGVEWRRGEQAKWKANCRVVVETEVAKDSELWMSGTKWVGSGIKLLSDRIITVKLVAGILRTAGGVVGKSKGECARCRMCGKEADGGETNYHVLWECTGGGGEAEVPSLR